MRVLTRNAAGKPSASIALLSGRTCSTGRSSERLRILWTPRCSPAPWRRRSRGWQNVGWLHIERRTQVERELAQVQQRLDRLVDALADGSLPADEIKTRLSTEKARKTALTADLTKLEGLAKIATVKVDQIADQLRTRISDVAGLLGRQTVQGRQMLRKVLADKIELEPVGSGRQRGYKFRGALSLEKLIAGEAMNNTSDYGGPNGIRTRV